MADEEDFLEALVASERVQGWLDVIQQANSDARRHQALREFAEAVQEEEAYAEEASLAGAGDVLTWLMQSTGDAGCQHAARAILTRLELDAAFQHKMRSFQYGDVSIQVTEGPLGRGLGARVWGVAHTMCRHLQARPALVAGKLVLEVGSGCGVCGIMAAKLHAAQVYLTDYEAGVLQNLRECVRANAAAPSGTPEGMAQGREAESDTAHMQQRRQSSAAAQQPQPADPGGVQTASGAADVADASPGWDFGSMHIRHLDWSDPCQAAADIDTQQLDSRLRFDLILGTDVLYEAAHARLVCEVISCFLAEGGRALLACAVRDQAIFDSFGMQLATAGLHASTQQLQPTPEMVGREPDYEGGFVLIDIKHGIS